MTDTNRRVLVTSIDDIAVETEPLPHSRPGQIRVRPTVVGICGSDTHAFLGSHPLIDQRYRHSQAVTVAGAAVTTTQDPRMEALWLRQRRGT
jgi:threonine dehydrogenase-like Zn-dependent dehydrogenase